MECRGHAWYVGIHLGSLCGSQASYANRTQSPAVLHEVSMGRNYGLHIEHH